MTTTRTVLSHRIRISASMLLALAKFAQPDGHGFGEHSYLSRATAKALQRRGLVTLGYGPHGKPWGAATNSGRLLLVADYSRRGLAIPKSWLTVEVAA